MQSCLIEDHEEVEAADAAETEEVDVGRKGTAVGAQDHAVGRAVGATAVKPKAVLGLKAGRAPSEVDRVTSAGNGPGNCVR